MKCNTVQDLVVLYKEGAVCDETRDEIRQHLFSCPRCRRFYRDYEKLCDDTPSLSCVPDEPPVHDFAVLARRVRVNHIIRSVSRIGAALLLCGVTVIACRRFFRSR